MVLVTIYLILAGIIAIACFVVISSLKTKGMMARALNMSLFLITLPRITPGENNQQKDDKQLIAVMEQLYTSLSNLHATGWNKFVYGEPYVVAEMAVHHVGEEIHFYMSVPRSFGQIFEKQVHGLFPTAEVSAVKDFNIFNPNGAVAGAYVSTKANPILPFRTYEHLESDPLGELATSLSKLEHEGEGAAIQIVFRPSHRQDIRKLAQKVAREMQTGHDFNKALSLAQSSKKPKEDPEKQKNEPPKVVTPFEEEIIKSLQAKGSRPLFDVNVRIVVSATEQGQAEQLLNDISGAFAQFSSPDLNNLKVNKVSGGGLRKLIHSFAFRMFDHGQQVYLSAEELTSLYHFPMTTALLPKVKFLKAQPAEPPANLPTQGVLIGSNTFRGRKTEIHMSEEDRRRHMYIIGQTGTGKSVFMESMIRQDLESGHGICVVDPHGSLAEFILSIIPRERAEDVIYFNPGDVDYPLGLNMLQVDPERPEQKTFVANELFLMLRSLYPDLPEAFGPMFEQYFKNSILLLMDVYEKQWEQNGRSHNGIEHMIPTLAEIPRVLTDEDFRREKLELETNPLVKNFWEQEAEKAGGEAALANMAPYINSKLSPFLANDYVRPIVAQNQSAFDFSKIMEDRKILIVNLSKGRIGEINANLLGMIVVNKILIAALARDASAAANVPDFYLYIDEFQNVTTNSIAIILSEARKYRLNLIVAHQFIKQLQENIRDAVFGNVGSMVVFRINPDDSEFLKTKFAPVFTPQDMINIDNLNAYINMLVRGQTVRPFNIQVSTELVFGTGSTAVAQAVAQISRLRYGRSRQTVEENIKSRYAVS